MSGKVLNLYKQLGETPLERLERLRAQRPEYAMEVLSYAGRLDPMAEGVMLALVGGANQQREQYMDLGKEYVLDVLFGFATDTYDILGRIMEEGDPNGISKEKVEKGLGEFRGRLSQEYPPYSSKTIEGKSLFERAREGMLGGIVLPKKTITVYEIELQNMYKVHEPLLLSYIEANVDKVIGDFRQEEILRIWKKYLRHEGTREFPAATVSISCSSGTYARSIANNLGRDLGTPALALHILRTKVGDYTVEKSLK